jgi:hypothetical protein
MKRLLQRVQEHLLAVMITRNHETLLFRHLRYGIGYSPRADSDRWHRILGELGFEEEGVHTGCRMYLFPTRRKVAVSMVFALADIGFTLARLN